MRIAVPRMGNLPLIVEDLARRFDLEYVEMPPFTEETLRIGVSLAPEFACLPLKAVLGGFVQAIENGADTLVMGGGRGPCRFGYYSEIQRRILEREGMEFQMITFDPPTLWPGSIASFIHALRLIIPRSKASLPSLARELTCASKKVIAFDEVEKIALAIRGLEKEEGSVDNALSRSRQILGEAFKKDEIEEARKEAIRTFDRIELNEGEEFLRIGLVGEIFIVLEPYFNFDVERWLARRGVSIERAVSISDTISRGKNPVFGFTERQIEKAARPYLEHDVGGDGMLSVGATVIFAKRSFDAVIHFLPFTCMPEVIAKSVLKKISEELNIPVLSLTIDEQTGRAGIETRLEALIDLARARKLRGTSLSLIACKNGDDWKDCGTILCEL